MSECTKNKKKQIQVNHLKKKKNSKKKKKTTTGRAVWGSDPLVIVQKTEIRA